MQHPLDLSSVPALALQNTLKTHYSENALVDYLVKSITVIPNFAALKLDVELVLHICKMVEVIATDSGIVIDKLEVVNKVYNQAFTMTTENTLTLVNIINYLHINKLFSYAGKSLWKKFGRFLSQLVGK